MVQRLGLRASLAAGMGSISSVSSVQSLSRVRLFATPRTAACQASLSITNSRSSLKPMSIESVMPSSHLILCRPLLLLPPIPPSIRVFPNESALHNTWPKYCSFSCNMSPSNEYPGLISFRMDWLDLLAIQGTLKGLLQVWVNSEFWNGLFRWSRGILNATMNVLTRERQKKRHPRGADDMTTEAETENTWPEPDRRLIPLCSWGYMGWILFFSLEDFFCFAYRFPPLSLLLMPSVEESLEKVFVLTHWAFYYPLGYSLTQLCTNSFLHHKSIMTPTMC